MVRLVILLALVGIIWAAPTTAEEEVAGKRSSITLKTTNTVIFSDQVTEESVSNTISALEALKDTEVFLFISSPGGSVAAGAVFNTYLSGTDKNITCIADFAASMAFAILQECPRRVAMKHSILMQHEASYGLPSAPLPNQRSVVNLIERQISVMTAQQAHRMGMDLDKFKSKVRDDYWVYGFEALADGVVDSIEIVSCSKQLINTHVKVTRQSFFGPIEAVLSGCPLVSFPLKVSQGVWEPFKNLSGEEIKLINVIGE